MYRIIICSAAVNYKQYGLYHLQWPARAPHPAGAAGILLGTMRQYVTTIVADVIGGLTVSRVGQVDFTSRNLAAQWGARKDFPA